MELNKLQEPLTVEEIEFRVQRVSLSQDKKKAYANLLAYKDARADMNRLDSVCGAFNWKREHLNSNANCIVSIWDDKKNQWISKEDTGTESFAEAAKGLASDSFKRACFNWGIGRELYDYPNIFFELNPEEFKVENGKVKTSFKFKLKDWRWYSEFTEGKLTYLSAVDNNKKNRFKFGTKKS
jgi:hypothetical protein